MHDDDVTRSTRLGATDARTVDAICRAFEAAWSSPSRPRIEDHLAGAACPLRAALLVELIALERELRQNGGERPETAEYHARFPGQEALVDRAFDDRTTRHDSAGTLASGRVPDLTDYQIGPEIARGGMGVVYRARQLSLNRPVALKLILPGVLATTAERRRFALEAELAAGLDHPNIVPVHEVGEQNGQPFFSMALVEGENLARRLARGPIPPREAARLVRDVAGAIQHAHDHGVIHRDLKPQNILLDADGRPRVTDFGLARRVEADDGLTTTGALLGTPSYMAPEQAAGDPLAVGPACDIHALGALLYVLLTGRPPFQAATPLETIRQVREDDPVPPRNLQPAVDRDLETICLTCLQKEPAHRYRSAAAVADDLGRWLAGLPPTARPITRARRFAAWCRRNPVVAGLAASLLAFLLILAGSTAAAVWFRNQAERRRHEVQAAQARARREHEAAQARADESRGRRLRLLIEHAAVPRAAGDPLAALPWYAGALALEDDLPVTRSLARLQLGLTFRQVPRLVADEFAPHDPRASIRFTNEPFALVSVLGNRLTRIDLPAGSREESLLDLPEPAGVLVLTPDARVAARLVRRPGPKPGSVVATLHAWDVVARRPAGPPIPLDGPGRGLALVPDGRRAITWDAGGPLRIWNLASGHPGGPEIPVADPMQVLQVLPSGDGRLLAVSMMEVGPGSPFEDVVQVFDATTGRPSTPRLVHSGLVSSMAFSRDGARLLTLAGSPTEQVAQARLWDTATGACVLGPLHEGESAARAILSAALSPDGRFVVTGSAAGARLWSRDLDPASSPVVGVDGLVVAVAFSPDGRRFATLRGDDGAAQVWESRTGLPLTPPLRQAGRAERLRFSPDGRLLVTAGRTPDSRLLEIRAWDLSGPAPGSGPAVAGRWPTDDGRLAVRAEARSDRAPHQAGRPWQISAVCLADGQPESSAVPLPPGHDLWHAALSRDGRRLVTVSADRPTSRTPLVRAWDLAPDPPRFLDLQLPGTASVVVLAPDSRRAAVLIGSTRREPDGAWLVDLDTGRGRGLPVAGGRALALVRFSPDGRRLLTVQPGRAQLWDPDTFTAVGPPLVPPAGPERPQAAMNRPPTPAAAAFAPDGSLLLVSLGGPELHRLDPATGAPAPGGPIPLTGPAAAIAFSADGRRFIVGLADTTAQVHDTRSGQAAGPPLSPLPTGPRDPHARDDLAAGPILVALRDDGRLALTAAGRTVSLWDPETGATVGPTFRASARIETLRFPVRFQAVAVTIKGTVEPWNLTPDPRPRDDLLRLARLLSGRRLTADDAETLAIPDDLRQTWTDLHGQAPELPGQPAEAPSDWHRRQAGAAEADDDPFAAVLHLDRLIADAPADLDLRRRRGEALGALDRRADAAADFAAVIAARPDDLPARLALAALRAGLDDPEAARAARRDLIAAARASHSFADVASAVFVAALRPDASESDALLALVDRFAPYLPNDPGLLRARAFIHLRAGRIADARRSALDALAAYQHDAAPMRFLAAKPRSGPEEPAPASFSPSPDRDDGTPRDWLLLALIEHRLGHQAAATAWRDKASRWLDRARVDPADPAVLGALGSARDRAMVRMILQGPLHQAPSLLRQGLRRFRPAWRSLLELDLLRAEIDRLLAPPSEPHATPDPDPNPGTPLPDTTPGAVPSGR